MFLPIVLVGPFGLVLSRPLTSSKIQTTVSMSFPVEFCIINGRKSMKFSQFRSATLLSRPFWLRLRKRDGALGLFEYYKADHMGISETALELSTRGP